MGEIKEHIQSDRANMFGLWSATLQNLPQIYFKIKVDSHVGGTGKKEKQSLLKSCVWYNVKVLFISELLRANNGGVSGNKS